MVHNLFFHILEKVTGENLNMQNPYSRNLLNKINLFFKFMFHENVRHYIPVANDKSTNFFVLQKSHILISSNLQIFEFRTKIIPKKLHYSQSAANLSPFNFLINHLLCTSAFFCHRLSHCLSGYARAHLNKSICHQLNN